MKLYAVDTTQNWIVSIELNSFNTRRPIKSIVALKLRSVLFPKGIVILFRLPFALKQRKKLLTGIVELSGTRAVSNDRFPEPTDLASITFFVRSLRNGSYVEWSNTDAQANTWVIEVEQLFSFRSKIANIVQYLHNTGIIKIFVCG